MFPLKYNKYNHLPFKYWYLTIPTIEIQIEDIIIWYSVAMVTTDVFQKNWIMMPRKLAKTVGIFVEIEHIKDWMVTFLVTNSVKFYDHSIVWEIAVRLFWAKMWPPRSLMCSISTNIIRVLVKFLSSYFNFFQKNIGHDHGNTNLLPLLNVKLEPVKCMLEDHT